MAGHTEYINCVHVKGADGEIKHTTFGEWTDDIWICVKDAKGFNHTYEGEARHLRDWCKHHGYLLRHQICELEIENPFDLED